jgi:hypothetical protein
MDLIVAFFSSLGSAISASLVNLFLAWLLLFRSAAFRAEVASLEKAKHQKEELRREGDPDEKTRAKKIKRVDDNISEISKRLTMKNMRYNLLSVVFLFIFNRLLRSFFQGTIVARLPFEPISFLTRVTHRGIETEDLRDGNFEFVYWLGTLLFRDLLTKWFGFQLPQLNFTDAMKLQ